MHRFEYFIYADNNTQVAAIKRLTIAIFSVFIIRIPKIAKILNQMSEDQKRQLNQQLWNIANTLRGKMDADEFRDYILGFIFYKYLSEKMELYANGILKEDKMLYLNISEDTAKGQEYLEAIREEALEKLGYYLKPSELFGQIAKRGNGNGKDKSTFIIEDIQKILISIQNSTLGTKSEEDFDHLFEDMDLNSTKLGKTAEQRNEVIAKVLSHLDKIDFKLEPP